MARILNNLTLQILREIANRPKVSPHELWKKDFQKREYKEIYNTVFRLAELGLVEKTKTAAGLSLTITEEGQKTLDRVAPARDGVWKLVIFDIPEKQKYVRVVLRAKLKSLHFRKWQNSIWVSPYKLDEEIEAELKHLAKRFFVRLIKTTDINETGDLEKLFEEK